MMERLLRTSLAATFTCFLTAVLMCGLAGCLDRGTNATGPPCSEETPGWAPPDPASVPDTLDFAGHRCVLQCVFWRNFMPTGVIPTDGEESRQGLQGICILVDVDRAALPSELSLAHLWVLHEGASWSTAFTSENHGPVAPDRRVENARCGPAWETGDSVDAVVEVAFGSTATGLVRATAIPIEKTD